MESDVPFKVYYQGEIRRFTLKPEQGLSYAELVQRIQSVFDISPTRQLRLKWLDQDGDKIAFSNSSELTDAVLYLSSTLQAANNLQMRNPAASVKIFVSAAPDSNASEAFNQGEIHHPGVYCDGCNSNLRGYRFKCLVCPDFDLCLTCLNRDLHNQHQMLLIRRPGDGWSHHGGGCGGWGGFGGGWGGPRRCFRQPQKPQQDSTQCPLPSQQQCPPYKQQQYQQCPPYQQQYQQYQQQYQQYQQQYPQYQQYQQQYPQYQQQYPQYPPYQQTADPHGSSATSAASGETVAEEHQQQQEQLIDHVTSAINTFLAPLGIDASIQVIHQSADAQVQAQAQSEAAHQQTHPSQPAAEAIVKASLITEARRIDLANSQLSVSQQPPASSSSSVQATSPRMENSGATFNADSGSSSDGNVGDFEFVGRSPMPAPPPPPSHQTAPGEPLDPKICRALEHMAAMGFSDDGGWLTRLLIAKDGDICGVLDAIRPIGK